jgi:hypothetical protein
MIFEDKIINCCDCQNDFDLTAEEQEFLFNKVDGGIGADGNQMTYKEPRRCKECRAIKRKRFNDK